MQETEDKNKYVFDGNKYKTDDLMISSLERCCSCTNNRGEDCDFKHVTSYDGDIPPNQEEPYNHPENCENIKSNRQSPPDIITGTCIRNLEKSYINSLSPSCLAYVGDSVYELYTRSFFVCNSKMKINRLHDAVVSFVSCRGQTQAYKAISDFLSDDEKDLFRRGRNAKSSVPRNADVYEYRTATGLECLLGYLFLSRDYCRLGKIMDLILNIREK